ncbi:SMI1/KNR4 family protein [Candidatus Odyssella acanthamoebae]|uniref:Knr4/Smi1-like domain-containing protein n=1 Tax=Candidatus Odyssella acanthamoebae TaxID=91604 RepID=A0A077AVX7_9PROT|nr:SMI1/KNR4 family protein [Candidatus Paracaedibacter acanthamoebae]AIK96204.1 hypothetical protein ID47_04750 [Candidatus Paracaedibacter acanthamoebae]
MQINDGGDTINETILEALEQVWKFNLPTAYRNFILKYNGGSPQPSRFFFKESPSNGSYVDYLFGIRKGFNQNLLMSMNLYSGRIPANMLPIGEDPGSNLILLSVKGPDRGKIYFWDHDLEADPAQGETPDYSNLTLIADSFDEFINGLSEEKDLPQES